MTSYCRPWLSLRGGASNIVRFIAGQHPYILGERVTKTRDVSCRTLKQWNNNLPKFHFRLKKEMLDYYHDVQYLIQGRGSASYTSWSPVHLGVMWGCWRTLSTFYTTDGSPFFRKLYADNLDYFRWNKVPSWRPNADRDFPCGRHPTVPFIAGQLAYILQERVTDSQFVMSDVETVE